MLLLFVTTLLCAPQGPATPPSIVGAWTLNKDLSGEPQTERRQDREGDRRGGEGRGADRGRYGRGGGMRGGGNAGSMDRERAQRLRDALRDELTIPERLTIVETESHMIVITSADGRVTRLSPDGQKIKDESTNVERRTKWDAGRLVSEVNGLGQARITETYTMTPDHRLLVTIASEGSRSAPAIDQKRVYDAGPK